MIRLIRRREGDDSKTWPAYVLGGRLRTSTVGLIVAFFLTAWLYETYQPPPPEPAPATQVVPPGFVPDPEYTWVPRTQVRPRTTYPTTTRTTTTTEPTPTTTTTSTDPTATTGPDDTVTSPTVTPPTTTVVDPDGPAGLVPPITLPVAPGSAPAAGPAPTPQTTATPPPPARSAG
ncbi:MAG: hypothetical protein ACSLFA_00975 [Mycobacterium sp.]